MLGAHEILQPQWVMVVWALAFHCLTQIMRLCTLYSGLAWLEDLLWPLIRNTSFSRGNIILYITLQTLSRRSYPERHTSKCRIVTGDKCDENPRGGSTRSGNNSCVFPPSFVCPGFTSQGQDRFQRPLRDRASGQDQAQNQDHFWEPQPRLGWEILFVSITVSFPNMEVRRGTEP